MQVVLVMFRSDGERRSFSVTRDVTVIGRREDCDLRIPLSDVSRKHCRFIKDGGTVRIEDLGSSNGTYHNGQRVQEAILSPGDTIQIGPVVFCIQIDGVPQEEEMAPIYHSGGEQALEDQGAEAIASGGMEEEFQILPEEGVAEEEPFQALEEVLVAEEEQLETLDEEPAAEEELSMFEEEPAAVGEAALVTEEDPVALEEETLEPVAPTPAVVAEEDSLETLDEEPLLTDEAEKTPAPAAATPPPLPPTAAPVPPPLPVADAAAESGEENPLGLEEIAVEEPLTFEEPAAGEEEMISLEEEPAEEVLLQDDVVEDFEIIEADETESEEKVDSKHKK